MTNEINDFAGANKFLSNFYLRPIHYAGGMYPALENAFQAQKTLDEDARGVFQSLSPGKAKRLGRQLDLRKDWDKVKDNLMLTLLRIKFQDTDLANKLLATYPKKLVEGNWWGDEYWGRCNGKGKNMLGVLLMKVRDELSGRTRETRSGGKTARKQVK